MQDIPQSTLNETTKAEQSAKVDLWEFDLTAIGGERYFFCNEPNEKGEPVTWQGRQYEPYPIQAQDFEMNGKGPSPRVTLVVSNLFGLVTGIAEDLQSLVGASVVRHQVYSKFLDAVNFSNGNPGADPEQEAVARYKVEQLSELDSSTATIILASPAETDGSV
ncbi:phage minor tail protein L, partial [Salmonella enterica subsp. enterica serovar Newport]|nr:phage minor tail protein L [Salmonella enterica subsp. enterica serovar Newport]